MTVDMSEFDAAETTYKPKCTVSTAIEGLPPDKAAALTQALNEPHRRHSAISKTLRAWGFNISSTTIGRHRRGDCGCSRD